MRKKLTILLTFAVAVFFTACGPTPEQAVKYNDQIINPQIEIIKKIDNLEDQFSTYNADNISAALEDAKTVVQGAIASSEKLNAFGESTDFKDAALKYFNIVEGTLKTEYSEMLKIYQLPDSLYGEPEEEKWNELSKLLDEKLSFGFNDFSVAQKDFAKKYNIELYDSADK